MAFNFGNSPDYARGEGLGCLAIIALAIFSCIIIAIIPSLQLDDLPSIFLTILTLFMFLTSLLIFAVAIPIGLFWFFERYHKRIGLFTSTSAAIILLIVGGTVLYFGVQVLYLTESEPSLFITLVNDLYANVGAELLSIAITVLIVDSLNKRNLIIEQKQDMILQMGSPDNTFAIEATRVLRQKGWLTDGTLQNAILSGANLQQANLSEANLSKAILSDADLSESNLHKVKLTEATLDNAKLTLVDLKGAELNNASLVRVNLADANLIDTDLRGATLDNAKLTLVDLKGAKLNNASLVSVNLADANLIDADLRGANLAKSILAGADISNASFDENTILPDAILYQNEYNKRWNTDTDMERYTNSDHKDFWQRT